MIAPFMPAGELLGPGCRVRTIVLSDAPDLPDGEYTFIDTYCTDSACDCRKTIIQVMHGGQLVSVVNFGWESPKFYLRWLGGTPDMNRDLAEEMSGLSIDFASPDRVSRDGVLRLMNHLLDEKWVSLIQDHYRQVRAVLKKDGKPDNIVRLPPRISRNAPCPCGSGKKYKHCCW
jgi:hypothetical protein